VTIAQVIAIYDFPRLIPSVPSVAFRGLAAKVVYFSLVAMVFVFVSVLLTGIHP
jgi:hypothetical protein